MCTAGAALIGSAHSRALDHADASDPRASRPRGERPVVIGQARHPPFEPLMVLGFGLYPAKPEIGTGRRGRSETFAEINLDLLSGDDVGDVWLLLSCRALSEGGNV